MNKLRVKNDEFNQVYQKYIKCESELKSSWIKLLESENYELRKIKVQWENYLDDYEQDKFDKLVKARIKMLSNG